MRTFANWEDLQTLVGTTTESADLDFKETLDPSSPNFLVEIGKDIAALANTLGGHLLVGTSTDASRTRCTGFHGVPPGTAENLGSAIERAAKDRCRPTPFVSTSVVDVVGKPNKVLVVRVDSSPVAPVGASVAQQSGGARVDEAWIFPYRVGSQTAYLSPDQFGVFESMTARRAAALLNAIPRSDWDGITLKWGPTAGTSSPQKPVRLVEVSPTQNVAVVEQVGGPQAYIRIPLDEVATVWMEQSRKWTVVLKGVLSDPVGGAGMCVYWPSAIAR